MASLVVEHAAPKVPVAAPVVAGPAQLDPGGFSHLGLHRQKIRKQQLGNEGLLILSRGLQRAGWSCTAGCRSVQQP